MCKSREHKLREVIETFASAISDERIADLLSFVDHGEFGLAIEVLSDVIYEEDVRVSAEQEKAILSSSSDFGVDHDYHSFLGRTPPYPSLPSPEQIARETNLQKPTLENVKYLAQAGQKLLAVKMYREITGVGLARATSEVERIAGTATSEDSGT